MFCLLCLNWTRKCTADFLQKLNFTVNLLSLSDGKTLIIYLIVDGLSLHVGGWVVDLIAEQRVSGVPGGALAAALSTAEAVGSAEAVVVPVVPVGAVRPSGSSGAEF